MILKGRKSPSRNPEQGAHLSRKGNPSPNLCLKGMEGSQGDPLHASHPCTREMPTARLSQTCSPDPRKTDPGKTEEGLSCLSKGWHRGKALGQAEMDPTTPWEGSRNPHNTQDHTSLEPNYPLASMLVAPTQGSHLPEINPTPWEGTRSSAVQGARVAADPQGETLLSEALTRSCLLLSQMENTGLQTLP